MPWIFCLLLLSPPAMAGERLEKARAAAAQFLRLDFFAEGRGMIVPPGFPPIKMESHAGKAITSTASRLLNDRFGIITQKGKIVGFKQVDYKGERVGVLSCTACHSGKAAGIFVPGLGNKNFDVLSTGKFAKQMLLPWAKQRRKTAPPEQREVIDQLTESSQHFLGEISNTPIGNLTQGLVPTAFVLKWFYDQGGVAIGHPTPGQVKIPALWGYGEKRKAGSFADGAGDGRLPGWAVLVELVAGQKAETARGYKEKINHAEDALADLLPPPYPFAVNREKAERGEALFTQNCAKCHGSYERDGDGLPIYKEPKLIPYHVVQTDYGRLSLWQEPGFKELVRANPLSDLIQLTDNEPGYMAQRLVGIWARFPYLHNGSVPSLYELLLPAAERSRVFSLRRAGERSRFDKQKLGLTISKDPQLQSFLERQARLGKRWVYDTSRAEHSSQGHEYKFYSDLNDDDRYAIIEYLKTL